MAFKTQRSKSLRIAKCYIRKNFPEIGKQLFKVTKDLKSKGLKFDKKSNNKGHMYVAKNVPGMDKGDKTFHKPSSGTFREITYLKDGNIRKQLNIIAETLAIPWVDSMHGFVNRRNIFTATTPHVGNKSMVNIDLQNAFNQITKDEVYYVFKYILDINKEDARMLTEFATYKGYLYQGCPYAPQVFNIVAIHLNISLSSSKLGIKFTSYADDLNFSSTWNHFGYGFVKSLLKIVENCGFRPNKSKTEFQSNRRFKTLLGLTIKHNQIVPKNWYKVKRKLKRLSSGFWKQIYIQSIIKGESYAFDSVKWMETPYSKFLYTVMLGYKGWCTSNITV